VIGPCSVGVALPSISGATKFFSWEDDAVVVDPFSFLDDETVRWNIVRLERERDCDDGDVGNKSENEEDDERLLGVNGET